MLNSIRITDFMDENLICLDLKSKTKDDILLELSKVMERSSNILKKNNEIYKALLERESIGSTGIGKGVAIPHAKTEVAEKLTITFGISKEKIDFKAMDNEKVNLFFVFASPMRDSQIYLKILARISRLIREESFRNGLLKCKNPKEILDYIREQESL